MNPNEIVKQTRRFIVFVLGTTILLIGILLIVLPGPAFIVIPLALAILATEFLWARKLLKRVKGEVSAQAEKLKKNFQKK